MGGSCSDLAVAENPCMLWKCVSATKKIEPLTWLLTLLPKTTYHRIPLKTVVMQMLPHSNPSQLQAMTHLLSVMKRAYEKNICPFFVHIYGVGYCDLSDITRMMKAKKRDANANNANAKMVVFHEQVAGVPLWKWLQSGASLQEKELFLLQLLYTCCVLGLSNVLYSLTDENVMVEELAEPMDYSLHVDTEALVYYKFQSRFKLRVVKLHSLMPESQNLELAKRVIGVVYPNQDNPDNPDVVLFPATDAKGMFLGVATRLVRFYAGVTVVRDPDESTAYGVRHSFFRNDNVPSLTVNTPITYEQDESVVEGVKKGRESLFEVTSVLDHLQSKTLELEKQRQSLVVKQNRIQAELNKFRK